MTKKQSDRFSAAEQSLGYLYQGRVALLRLLQSPENTSLLIEKDDDLDFIDDKGKKSLASLKHKAVGDRVSDLSVDFWKSVRIWLSRYDRDGRAKSDLRFFLFTTATVSDDSFLKQLSPDGKRESSLCEQAADALLKSKSSLIQEITAQFSALDRSEQEDFLSRITIFDNEPRIVDVPSIIVEQHMRTVRREFRQPVFERLEGWLDDRVITHLSQRGVAIFGYEVSDKMASIADEYKSDNLSIDFRGKKPAGGVDAGGDPRLFVKQLRAIDVSADRIQNAILDYYRAFEQRSLWARENVLISGEIEEYEDRLADEWKRYRDVVFELLDDDSPDKVMLEAGRALYLWAEMETGHIRIRERVSEPYVVRGGFHILANVLPRPTIYWHPLFLQKLGEILGASA